MKNLQEKDFYFLENNTLDEVMNGIFYLKI